jgi:hypothetical protein
MSASTVTVGVPVQPLRRLQIMEEDEWEEFILEWVDALRQNQQYTAVHRCGGTGDLGRDIIAFKAPIGPTAPWDNYQCKHYARGLSVSDAVLELGKMVSYAAAGYFRLPDAYFFLTPRGPSTDLLKTLQRGALKQSLIDRWEKEIRNKIASGQSIPLTPGIMAQIDAFDFSKVTVVAPPQIIEEHRKTRYHIYRFGGGLPARALPIPKPPAVFEPNETVYLKKLLDAYAEDQQTTFTCIDEVSATVPELRGIFIAPANSSSARNHCAPLAATTSLRRRLKHSKRRSTTACKRSTTQRTKADTSAR